MHLSTILAECRTATGAGSKKIIQGVLANADDTARRLIAEALNPYRTFGVKRFDMPQSSAKSMNEQQNYQPFFDLLDKLATRELYGDAAREAVTATLGKFNAETQEALACVLDKDLRAGFSADSANKAWKSNVIPSFDVMLADKCDDTDDFAKYVPFPCQADWKYDGQRTIAIVRDTGVEYRSRPGLIMEHLAGVFDEDLMNIRADIGYDYVLDGESFAGDFTETINAKKAGNDKAKAALRLRAFFLMPLSDWIAQKTTITMRQNRDTLETVIFNNACKKITLSGGREVKDFHDMTAYCAEVTSPGFDGQPNGHEGLILKAWDSPYVWDRSMTWCKVKNFYDVDCKIVGFYKGKPKTKNANRLGGVKVWGRVEDGTIIECDVGSGWTDAQRDEIWANQDKYLGKTLVVKYQEVSKSKNKDIASLRFPTAEHFRDDKVVE